MRGRHSHIKRSNRKPIFVIAAVFVLIALTAAGGLLAKYRSENIKEAEMIAENFHVSSNYLGKSGTAYALAEWQDGIDIELYNYEKENEGLVASSDITYKVEASGFSVSVKSGDQNQSPDGNGYYTLKKTDNKTVHTIHLTPGDLQSLSGQSVSVKITTGSPFEKTLEAKFTLGSKIDFAYQVVRKTDNGDYYEMTVYTNQYSGTLKFTWPEQLIPDNTNAVMHEWTGKAGNYAGFEKLSTYKLIFFNPQQIENLENSFTVTAAE